MVSFSVFGTLSILFLAHVTLGGPACNPGDYYDDSISDCNTCNPGYYCPGDDNRYPCTPGNYAMLSAATMCDPCPAGTFSAAEHADECTPCDTNEAAMSGSTSCMVCSPGQSPNLDKSQCTQCLANFYSTDGSTCTACNAGTYSPPGSISSSDCKASSPSGIPPKRRRSTCKFGEIMCPCRITSSGLQSTTLSLCVKELVDGSCGPCPLFKRKRKSFKS